MTVVEADENVRSLHPSPQRDQMILPASTQARLAVQSSVQPSDPGLAPDDLRWSLASETSPDRARIASVEGLAPIIHSPDLPISAGGSPASSSPSESAEPGLVGSRYTTRAGATLGGRIDRPGKRRSACIRCSARWSANSRSDAAVGHDQPTARRSGTAEEASHGSHTRRMRST